MCTCACCCVSVPACVPVCVCPFGPASHNCECCFAVHNLLRRCKAHRQLQLALNARAATPLATPPSGLVWSGLVWLDFANTFDRLVKSILQFCLRFSISDFDFAFDCQSVFSVFAHASRTHTHTQTTHTHT